MNIYVNNFWQNIVSNFKISFYAALALNRQWFIKYFKPFHRYFFIHLPNSLLLKPDFVFKKSNLLQFSKILDKCLCGFAFFSRKAHYLRANWPISHGVFYLATQKIDLRFYCQRFSIFLCSVLDLLGAVKEIRCCTGPRHKLLHGKILMKRSLTDGWW